LEGERIGSWGVGRLPSDLYLFFPLQEKRGG